MDFGRGLGGFGQAWGWQEGMKTGSNGDSSRNTIFQQFWTGFEGALGGVMGGLREGFGRVWLSFWSVWGHLGHLGCDDSLHKYLHLNVVAESSSCWTIQCKRAQQL